jgi:acetyltransferase
VAREGRRMLTEPEAKAAIAAYGVEVPQTIVAESPQAVKAAAAELLRGSKAVVVKVLSKAISHKSDIGGVVLNLETGEAAEQAAGAILERVRQHAPQAGLEGFAVQPMVVRKHAQ